MSDDKLGSLQTTHATLGEPTLSSLPETPQVASRTPRYVPRPSSPTYLLLRLYPTVKRADLPRPGPTLDRRSCQCHWCVAALGRGGKDPLPRAVQLTRQGNPPLYRRYSSPYGGPGGSVRRSVPSETRCTLGQKPNETREFAHLSVLSLQLRARRLVPMKLSSGLSGHRAHQNQATELSNTRA